MGRWVVGRWVMGLCSVDMSKFVIDTAINNLIFTETLILEKMTW